MNGWTVLLCILGVLALLFAMPAGARIRYHAQGFFLTLIYGPFRIRLIPSRKKTKEKKKPVKEKKPTTSAPPKVKGGKGTPAKKGGGLSGILEYVPIVKDLLDGIRVRLLVRKMVLYVNLAGEDPCDLALLYGKATAAAGCAIPLLEQVFRIRRRDVQIFCDFTAEQTEIYLDLAIVASPARILWLVLRQGIRFLRTFMKQKTAKAV